MKRFSRPSRTSAKLSKFVNQNLNMYMLSATAASVGMMALAQPAQAKIIYTQAHVNFSQFPPVTLDLNHDGTADFMLALGGGANSDAVSQFAFVYAPRSNPSNGAVATAKGAYQPAVALRAGSRIGSGRLFNQADILVEHYSHLGKGSSSTYWEGQWGNGGKGLKNRYLGLKFMIDGKVHFGWARVTVATSGRTFTAILTGYAYETIPNKSIIAGQTKGQDEIDNTIGQTNPASLAAPIPESATLGLLAMGSPGLSIWRRKEAAEPTQ
jgi:hypothetical protein